jgi:DNA helicase-2/ATP-dependent DNA helicase PcrA
MELVRRRVPFELLSGLRFFEQAHVKDVAAFIKFSMNTSDQISFLRITKLLPGVGPKTAEKLWLQIKGGCPLAKVKPPGKASAIWDQWLATHEQLQGADQVNRPSVQIQTVIDAIYEDYMKTKFSNYPSRMEDLGQLRSFSEAFTNTEEFLAQLALMTSVDGGPKSDTSRDHDGPVLRLSTIHQAKGLEWKVVFIIMLGDGLFPSLRSIENAEVLEEERRLFYVAVTRARDELYLSYPRTRASADGSRYAQEPSRFLREIPKDATIRWSIVDERMRGMYD